MSFLQIDKEELLGSGLSSLEILIVAQVQEFERNTGNCFISNEELAKQFGTSVSSVKRAIDALDKKGIIIRETKTTNKGKIRHMHTRKVQNAPSSVSCNEAQVQDEPCAGVNMSASKGHIEPIKENIKDNKKDNNDTSTNKNGKKTNHPEEEMNVEYWDTREDIAFSEAFSSADILEKHIEEGWWVVKDQETGKITKHIVIDKGDKYFYGQVS